MTSTKWDVILKYYTIKKFDFVRNKSERPKFCEIVNSRQNFSHVFLYTRVVFQGAVCAQKCEDIRREFDKLQYYLYLMLHYVGVSPA
jgi:hypothetical protein